MPEGSVMLGPHGRVAYAASLAEFQRSDRMAVLGQLADAQAGDATQEQRRAWLHQIDLLQQCCARWPDGWVCFEFVIPRIGKRADNVVLIGGHVFVLEFKAGAEQHDATARRQAVDYALDLRHFHAGSSDCPISPVLVATEAQDVVQSPLPAFDNVFPLLCANAHTLADLVAERAQEPAPPMDVYAWLHAAYRPTPTIVEASQALYRQHDVRAITHAEASSDNLGETTAALNAAIDAARAADRKVICFVSGVPGAGKTLAGLNLVCARRHAVEGSEENAVFLSGNGPLVHVLQEALARDEVDRTRGTDAPVSKSVAQRNAVAFIQNIHHFRDAHLSPGAAPVERLVVFDEAQRAWDRQQTAKFMAKKKGHPDFDRSEPEFLIEVMNRHQGYCAVVCLIGGGQEINTGEAGLVEWLRALRDRFPDWNLCLAGSLHRELQLEGFDLDQLGDRLSRVDALHLGVSLRSFRAESLSTGIGHLMAADVALAKAALQGIVGRYPIAVTRDLSKAKDWVRERARGSERIGLLASSGARRLKPLGVRVDVKIDPASWFLNAPEDVRSSHYLEDVGTEFDVQGLELDWAVVVWDADLRWDGTRWVPRAFKGTRWQAVNQAADRRYCVNAYRVLLTRARQGMVIVVPEGDRRDPTRLPDFYDPVWQVWQSLDLPLL